MSRRIFKFTYTNGTVVNVPIVTTFTGKAFVGVLKNAIAVTTDKLRQHNTIGPDDEVVSAVAIRKAPPTVTVDEINCNDINIRLSLVG